MTDTREIGYWSLLERSGGLRPECKGNETNLTGADALPNGLSADSKAVSALSNVLRLSSAVPSCFFKSRSPFEEQ
jgi:hypothetical protein